MKYLSFSLLAILFLFFSCHNHSIVPIVQQSKIEGEWNTLTSTDNSHPIERHEAAFVKVSNLLILLGGRGIKPVSIYNIHTKKWSTGAPPPIELHHFQPVVYNNSIYIVGAFTGGWPDEKPVPNIYRYSPGKDSWTKGSTIPTKRQRGATGAVLVEDQIFVVCGIKNGHIDDHKNWLDMYDLKTDTWTQLPDAPRPRDHFQAVAAEGQIFVMAGRRSSAPNDGFKHTIKEVDIYDIAKKEWTTASKPIPTPRAGNFATLYNKEVLILGGESGTQVAAHNEVEGFHINNLQWTSHTPMIQGRHGTGAALVGDKIIIASGCGNRGGQPELQTIEAFIPKTDTIAPFLTYQPTTSVSVKENSFLINGVPTYQGRTWQDHKIEGLLFNARLVQGIFDDSNPNTRKRWKYPKGGFSPYRNTKEFVEAMPSWKEHGLLAFSLNMQGGSPMGYGNKDWINTPYDSLGNLKQDYLMRLDMILRKADELEMAVILGLFYFGQDQHLKDEAAVIAAVDNTINWLHQKKYRNVLIEINNECDSRGYDHEILKEHRVHELMQNVKMNMQYDFRYLVSTSFEGHVIPTDNVVKEADFILLHGNGVKDPFRIAEMVETTRNLQSYHPMPILFNEDDHYAFDRPKNNCKAATMAYASWGYFDYRRRGESFSNGFQSVPVDWRISSPRKKWFFNYVKKITMDSTVINL